MSNYSITSRYSLALQEMAEEKNIYSSVVENVELVFASLQGSRELRNYLSTPIISEQKKMELLEAVFTNYISEDVLNFMKFVVKKGRINLLKDILSDFLKKRDEKENITDVVLKSTYKLDETQSEVVKNQLEKFSGKKIRFSNRVDESIIGGYIAEINDVIVDASVKRQLEKIKNTLINE